MCRLIIFHGNSVSCKSIFLYLIDLLIKVSKHDCKLEEVYKCLNRKNRTPDHPDGYGYFIALAKGRTVKHLYYYKSSNSIYEDFHGITNVKNIISSWNYEVYGLIHVRKASINEPLGLLHSHPFIVRINDKLLSLIHNGSINKFKVCLDLNFNQDICSKVSDSYMALIFLKHSIEHGAELLEAIKELMDKYVDNGRSSVLGVCNIDNDLIDLYYGFRIKYHGECFEKIRDYYRPYILYYNGCTALVSSSIYDIIIRDKYYKNTIRSYIPPLNIIGKL